MEMCLNVRKRKVVNLGPMHSDDSEHETDERETFQDFDEQPELVSDKLLCFR